MVTVTVAAPEREPEPKMSVGTLPLAGFAGIERRAGRPVAVSAYEGNARNAKTPMLQAEKVPRSPRTAGAGGHGPNECSIGIRSAGASRSRPLRSASGSTGSGSGSDTAAGFVHSRRDKAVEIPATL